MCPPKMLSNHCMADLVVSAKFTETTYFFLHLYCYVAVGYRTQSEPTTQVNTSHTFSKLN